MTGESIDVAEHSDSSLALRRIAFGMLGHAHEQRNAAEWRLWAARDEVARLRLLYLEAQSKEAIAQRDFDRAQELLRMIWTDANPRHSEPVGSGSICHAHNEAVR